MNSAVDKPAEKFFWLDWLRFLAALTVVMVHVRYQTFVPLAAIPEAQRSWMAMVFYLFTRVGNEAVLAFFVLSGFLVGGKNLERAFKGEFRPFEYTIDRVTRIMLPLIPALVLTALSLLILDRNLDWIELLGNLISMQGVLVNVFGGNASLWSLSYEVWFYVIAGAAGCLLTSKHRIVSSVALVLAGVVFTRLSWVYLACWLIGVVAYFRRPERASVVALVGAFLAGVYAVLCIQMTQFSASFSGSWYGLLKPWILGVESARLLFSLGFACLIRNVICLVPEKRWWLLMENLGTRGALFSYSLYLTHYPVIQLMTGFGLHQSSVFELRALAIYVSSVFLCLLVAYGVYLISERHTAYVRRWVKQRSLLIMANKFQSG